MTDICFPEQVLDYLRNEEKQKQLSDGEFESLIETAIKHSMTVASLAEKKDEQRQLVIKTSQRVWFKYLDYCSSNQCKLHVYMTQCYVCFHL